MNPILWWHNVSHNIDQLFASEAEQLKKAEEKTEKLKTAQKADGFFDLFGFIPRNNSHVLVYHILGPRPPFASCAI